MATFAGITCDSIKGFSNAPTRRTETFTRPGVNGHGALDLGNAAEPNRYELTKIDTYANVKAWTVLIQAQRGNLVTVDDDWATTTYYWLFDKIDTPQIRRGHKGTALAIGKITVRGYSQV